MRDAACPISTGGRGGGGGRGAAPGTACAVSRCAPTPSTAGTVAQSAGARDALAECGAGSNARWWAFLDFLGGMRVINALPSRGLRISSSGMETRVTVPHRFTTKAKQTGTICTCKEQEKDIKNCRHSEIHSRCIYGHGAKLRALGCSDMSTEPDVRIFLVCKRPVECVQSRVARMIARRVPVVELGTF